MSDEKKIDTGGSACITGNVTVIGGDFVGRDKVIADLKAESDELQAEVLKGDKAGEDLVDGKKKDRHWRRRLHHCKCNSQWRRLCEA